MLASRRPTVSDAGKCSDNRYQALIGFGKFGNTPISLPATADLWRRSNGKAVMQQLLLGLNDRQLVRSTVTGAEGRLDHIKGNLAFVQFPGVGYLTMCAVENIKPVGHLFIWARYFGENNGT